MIAHKKILHIAFIYICLFVLGLMHASISLTKSASLLDEGFNFELTNRILSGQIPYKDFYLFATPLFFYYSAFIVKFLQIDVEKLRYVGVVVSSIHSMAIFHISRMLFKNYKVAFIAWLLTLALGVNTNWLLHHYSWHAVTMALIALIFLLHWQETKKSILLVATGIVASLCLLTKQTIGLYVLLSIGIFFTVANHHTTSLKKTGRDIALLACGFLIPIGVFLTHLFVNNALPAFILNTMKYPLTLYTQANVFPPPLSELTQALYALLHPRSFNMQMLYPILYYSQLSIVIITVFTLIRRSNKIDRKATLVLLFFLGLFLQTNERISSRIVQSISGIAIVSFMVLCSIWLKNIRKILNMNKLLLNALLVSILVVEICIYLKVSFFKPFSAPLAGVETYTVTPDFGERYDHMYSNINPVLKDEEYVFVYPLTPILYTMFDVKNPTKASLFIVGHLNENMEQETISMLKDSQPTYIIYDEPFIIDGKGFSEQYPKLNSYILNNYESIYEYNDSGKLLKILK